MTAACERFAVADLHGQPALRCMQHGLAVKADYIYFFRCDIIFFKKLIHRICMTFGEFSFYSMKFGIRYLSVGFGYFSQAATKGFCVSPSSWIDVRRLAAAAGYRSPGPAPLAQD